MEENKRMLMLFAGVLLFVGIILVIAFWPKTEKIFECSIKKDETYDNLAKINYEDYECLQKKENIVIAFGDLNKKEKENLNEAANNMGIGIYYFNAQSESEELKKVKKMLTYSDNSFKKDVILLVNEGNVASYEESVFNDVEKINSFLEKNGLASFACGLEASDEFENLAFINYEEYECLYEGNKEFVLVLAQTTCSHCINYEPVINEYAGENKIPVYVMNVDELSQDEFSKFSSSLDYFKENEQWGTPLTLAIKNKAVIAEVSGNVEKESIDLFMEEAGIK